MELHQLRYFCAAVNTGTFTKAAEQEGIAQPSLSQQIRRLEKSLDAELFVRLGRTVRLTHAGSVFFPYAQHILSQSKRAAAKVRHLGTEAQGPLRVGVISTVLPYLIAPHLPDFTRQYPGINVILTENTTDRLVGMLQDCDLDLIIVSLPMRQSGLICSEILREQLVLVTSKDHKFLSPPTATPDLSREHLLLLKEGHCFREDMLTACKRGKTEVAPVFEADHFGSIFPLVASGAGITIAPLMAAEQAENCSVVSFGKAQYRRIGYARLRSGANFKPLSAFTKWLRNVAYGMNKELTE